ncbi:hypothetical protein JXL21_08075 [Candidatus Bathyarchaeota archaeon]|nr:hypothetical protein [Candidatus Bathyarchaeota archaeon]
MVLMEKALSLRRQDIVVNTAMDHGEVSDQKWGNRINGLHIEAEMRKAVSKSTDYMGGLVTGVRGWMGNVNAAVLTAWGEAVSPRLSSQVTVALDRTTLKEPKLGGFELEKTQIYEMEPFAGPEKHYDLGIELFDIESSWK